MLFGNSLSASCSLKCNVPDYLSNTETLWCCRELKYSTSTLVTAGEKEQVEDLNSSLPLLFSGFATHSADSLFLGNSKIKQWALKSESESEGRDFTSTAIHYCLFGSLHDPGTSLRSHL